MLFINRIFLISYLSGQDCNGLHTILKKIAATSSEKNRCYQPICPLRYFKINKSIYSNR